MVGLVRTEVGPPYWSDVLRDSRRLREHVLGQAAEAIVNRTQRRLRANNSDRLARALRFEQQSYELATIRSTYGGPGVIRPVRKQALFWPGAPHPFAKVNGKGIEPLIRAEARRLQTSDLPDEDITLD